MASPSFLPLSRRGRHVEKPHHDQHCHFAELEKTRLQLCDSVWITHKESRKAGQLLLSLFFMLKIDFEF